MYLLKKNENNFIVLGYVGYVYPTQVMKWISIHIYIQAIHDFIYENEPWQRANAIHTQTHFAPHK